MAELDAISVDVSVLILGARQCGKTALVHALTGTDATETLRPVGRDGAQMRLKLIERPLPERPEERFFAPELEAALRGAFCVLVAYDVTRRVTYESARESYCAIAHSAPQALSLLIGCKADMTTREVSPDLDVPRDAFVLEVSSEEHTNIELVLRLICLQAEHMLRARAAGRANPLGVAVDVVGSASLDASLESARERVRAHEMLLLQTPRPTASGADNAGGTIREMLEHAVGRSSNVEHDLSEDDDDSIDVAEGDEELELAHAIDGFIRRLEVSQRSWAELTGDESGDAEDALDDEMSAEQLENKFSELQRLFSQGGLALKNNETPVVQRRVIGELTVGPHGKIVVRLGDDARALVRAFEQEHPGVLSEQQVGSLRAAIDDRLRGPE